MPKELHEINKFFTGTILTPSETDIPDDAASFSKNLDPVAEDGKLKGIATDKVLKISEENITWSNTESDATSVDIQGNLGLINKNGEYTLVYYDGISYKALQNVFGIPVSTTLSNAEAPSAVANNNYELHIGTDGRPQWIGYINNTQFGTAYDGLYMVDSALTPPGSVANVDRAFYRNGKIYAVREGEPYLHQFDASTFSYDGQYTDGPACNAIRMALPDKDNANVLWIVDESATADYFDLIYVDVSTNTHWLNTFTGVESDIGDIGQTTNNLWVARRCGVQNISDDNVPLIYRFPTPTEALGTPLTVTNVTWDANFGETETGSILSALLADREDAFHNILQKRVITDSYGTDTGIFVQTDNTTIRSYYKSSDVDIALATGPVITAPDGFEFFDIAIDNSNNILFYSVGEIGEHPVNANCRTRIYSQKFSYSNGNILLGDSDSLAQSSDDDLKYDLRGFAKLGLQLLIYNYSFTIAEHPDGGEWSAVGSTTPRLYAYNSDGTFGTYTDIGGSDIVADGQTGSGPDWYPSIGYGSSYILRNGRRYEYSSFYDDIIERHDDMPMDNDYRFGVSGVADNLAWTYKNGQIYAQYTGERSEDYTGNIVTLPAADTSIIGCLGSRNVEGGSLAGYTLYTMHNDGTLKTWLWSVGDDLQFTLDNTDTTFAPLDEVIAVSLRNGGGVTTPVVLRQDALDNYYLTKPRKRDDSYNILKIQPEPESLIPCLTSRDYIAFMCRMYDGSGDKNPVSIRTDNGYVELDYLYCAVILNDSSVHNGLLDGSNGKLLSRGYYSRAVPNSNVITHAQYPSYFPETDAATVAMGAYIARDTIGIASKSLIEYAPVLVAGDPDVDETGVDMQYLSRMGGFDWLTFDYVNGAWDTEERYSALLDFSSALTGTASTAFADNTRYYYAVSLEYDGFQESPLLTEIEGGDPNTNQGVDPDTLNLTIQLNAISQINKRVTALNLYRAENTDTNAGTPEGYYRLVTRLPFDTSWQINVAADTATKTLIDDGRSFSSYEARTGMSEVLDETAFTWNVSTMLNNHHFIGNANVGGLYDDKSVIFKSAPYKPNMFNYVYDVLMMPTSLTALAAFGGRLYAFSRNTMYRIDPNGFYIEDTIDGIGCLSQASICITDYGMCFADGANIYLHDGRNVAPIGGPILRGDDNYAWQNIDIAHKFFTSIQFDTSRNTFLVTCRIPEPEQGGEATTYQTVIWGYNITRKRWDMLLVGEDNTNSSTNLTGVMHQDGAAVLYEGGVLRRLFAGNATRAWSWTSKKLTFNTDTQDKIFKRARITGTSANIFDTVTTSEGTPDSEYANDSDNAEYTFSGSARRGKWIQYAIAGSTAIVDSIGTIFRRRPAR